MIQEEIFEVDKKIKQIEGILEKRKEKANEWSTNYKKILQDRPDKTAYLFKQCPSKLMLTTANQSQLTQAKQDLESRCAMSRSKIKTFYNELKELDLLQKRKHRIRIDNSKENNKKAIQKETQAKENRQKVDKSGGSEIPASVLCSRTMKDRHNPFANCKAEKFIEFYQQNKVNQDQMGSKIMRYFGVGIENTPVGPLLKKQERKEDKGKAEKDSCGLPAAKHPNGRKFVSAFKEKVNWFQPSSSKNLFQDRIRKIIKCHGEFWGEELEIK